MSTSRQPYCENVVIVPPQKKAVGFQSQEAVGGIATSPFSGMYAQGSGKLETLSPIVSPIVSPTVFSTSHPPRTLEPCLSLCLPLCHLIFKLVFPTCLPLISQLNVPPLCFPACLPLCLPLCLPFCLPLCLPPCLPLVSQAPPYMVSKSSPSCFTDVVSHLSPNCHIVFDLPPTMPSCLSEVAPPIIPNWFPLVSMSDLPIVSQLCPLALALHLKSSLLLGCKAVLIVMYGVAVWYRILLRHNLITSRTHTMQLAKWWQSDGWTWDGCTRINECINMYQSMSMETHLASGLQT